MKASELRIGNYVLDNLGGILKINGISNKSTIYHIKPIAITEDWLLKMGFEKKNHIYSDKTSQIVFKNKRAVMIITDRNEFIYSLSSPSDSKTHNYVTELDSVHELQNIFFSTHKEELTLNTE